MRRHDWHGPIAFVLAVTLGFVLCVLVVRWAVSARPLGDIAGAALATTVGGLVGAVSSYLGHTQREDPRTRERRTDHDRDEPEH